MRTSFKLAFPLLVAVLAIRSGLVLRTELGALRLYQATLSPVFARTSLVQCRFHPTCSVYAVQALTDGGLCRGNVAIVKRLAACSPIGYLYDRYSPAQVHREGAKARTQKLL